MKRKILALILIILILAPFVQTASADNSGLCYTATNDKLLDIGLMTAFVGGVSYVPAEVLSTFGVYYNYFDSSTTAMLFNSNKQIFFELSSGNTKDSAGTTYSVSATFKNGQVYVPASWVCTYFGLNCSVISGSGYGDILRIKNGAEVLSDWDFLDAATSIMRTRYNEYYGTSTPVSPSPTPTQNGDDDINGASVSLSFIGLPSDKLLNSLDNYSANVCFFVTADEVMGAPDTVRRICGSGHSIGIYCASSPETECENTSELIFEAAQVRPILVTSPVALSQSLKTYAEANGYAYFEAAIKIADTVKSSSVITSELKDAEGYTSIIIPYNEYTDSFLPYVLQFISNKHITIVPLRETLV